MPRCAKSWQTPRRFSKTSSSGVATVVALAIEFEILKNPPGQIPRPRQQRRVRGKTFARVIGQFQRRAHLRRIKNKLIRFDDLRRNRIAEHFRDRFPGAGDSFGRRLVRAHGHAAVRDDFEPAVDFLDGEKAKPVAEIIRARLAQRGFGENFQRKTVRVPAWPWRAVPAARRDATPSPARRIRKACDG